MCPVPTVTTQPGDADESGQVRTATSARARNVRPHNLPFELSSFVGRRRELAEVGRLLEHNRLVTLTGPGGCGKTRLALEVSGGLVERFADGVRLVELAPLSDPTLVPQAVSTVLPVREERGRALVDTMRAHLEGAELLLVLDNCEHLIEPCAKLASALLRSCPGLRILATSREPLDIAGEVSWLVPPLSLPDADPATLDPASLSRYEAVRLFTQRAGAVHSDFVLTAENAPTVANLCRRLEGMPLAIELAASRVRVLTLEQIVERVDDCFRLLKGGDRAASPRHQTLWATVNWSHDLLSEEERKLFRRLSVFAGGFSLAAAEEVCSWDGVEREDVLDLLSSLVDKSLVLFAEQRGEARYQLLETVRQYGREKVARSGEEAEVRRRHADYFLELAETAERAMNGSAQETWVERLEVEHDNLRAALDWDDRGAYDATETRLRLAAALAQFWVIRGHFTEGLTRLEGLLTLPAGSVPGVARAKACEALGSLYYRRGDHAADDFVRARARYEESVEIFRESGDERQIALALALLGRVYADLGEYTSARSMLEDSLRLHRGFGDAHGIAVVEYGLGWVDFLQGELASARLLLERSLATFRKLGDKFHLGGCILYLGCLDCEGEDYAAARAKFVTLTELVSFQHYRYVAPLVVEAFVVLAATQGQAERALRLGGAAAEQRRVMGAQFRLGWQQYLARRLEPCWAACNKGVGAAAWAEGKKMTLERALSYALGEPAANRRRARAVPERTTGPLSNRELEVLGLVAEGLTDARVAERLHLSPRTVGRHLESIYRKLGVSSRTAAAKRAAELGLL
jgi:predicted ATPase/DNA-binding CsgD family transcriptional regulator